MRDQEGRTGRTPDALRRLKPGMSLRSLSKRTGIPLPHLSRVINGRRGLTVGVAWRICVATGCSVDRVLTVLAPHLQANGHNKRKKTV